MLKYIGPIPDAEEIAAVIKSTEPQIFELIQNTYGHDCSLNDEIVHAIVLATTLRITQMARTYYETGNEVSAYKFTEQLAVMDEVLSMIGNLGASAGFPTVGNA